MSSPEMIGLALFPCRIPRLRFWGSALLVLLLLGFSSLVVRADLDLPQAEEIVDRVIERFRTVQSQTPPAFYEFSRSTITEELDEHGVVKKSKVRRSNLVRPKPSATPAANGDARSPDQRGSANGSSSPEERELKSAKRKNKEIVLDHRLLDRFAFEVLGCDEIAGRTVYLLSFEPKKDLPVRELQDRVLNKIAGKVWVDEKEYEVARVELRLTEKVTLAWGILGAMHEFRFLLDRVRMPEGIWIDGNSSGSVQYRKLLDSSSLRWRETADGFRRVSGQTKETKPIDGSD